jgi:uncharacterized protein (TIGR04222 family)
VRRLSTLDVYQRIADFLAGWPLVMLAGLLILALIVLIVRSPRRKKPPTPPEGAHLDPPDDLAPALAGALTAGRVQENQLDATLLDFARRSVIAMEPDDDGLRIHVLQATPDLSDYEQRHFATITEDADSDGIISSHDLGKLRGDYNPTRLALRNDMVARGWFAQDAAHRKPVFILAAISIVVAVIGFVVAAIAQSPVGIGVALALFAVAIAGFAMSAAVPNTTEAGEMAAFPWRTYQESLRRQTRQPSSPVSSPEWLDRLIPLAVALGLSQAFNPLLKAASATGYSPAWLGWPTGANSAAFIPLLGFVSHYDHWQRGLWRWRRSRSVCRKQRRWRRFFDCGAASFFQGEKVLLRPASVWRWRRCDERLRAL